MNLGDLTAKLEQRAVEADAQRSTAPVGDTLRWVLAELGGVGGNGNGDGGGRAPTRPDVLLTAGQVAERLHCSLRYVYAHAGAFPFTVRLAPHAVRFSAAGLERWVANR